MSEPAAGPPARPQYREGQILQAQDLLDEQAYRIRARRCHAIGEHRWGIAQGLKPAKRKGGGITLQPGAAVDGYGRTLLVPEPVEVPASILEGYGKTVDLWLGYCREPVTPAQRGTWACGPGRDSRWRERAVLRFSRAPETEVDPRRPPGVPQPDRDFPPHRAPPDDPARQWPVYLGRLDTQTWSVCGTRPYIGLVGDAIVAPSGRARMQVGDEGRFAVSVTGPATPAGSGPATPAGAESGPATLTGSAPIDRLVVATTATTVTGYTAVGEGLSLAAAGKDAAGPNHIVLEPTPSPAAAAPWTIRRTAAPDQQLRIEIRDPGKQANPANYRLVIGRTVNGTFKPCLSVDANCQTTIYGPLEVGGRIALGPIPADPNDPRFAAAIIGQWIKGGASTAATGIDILHNTTLAVSVDSTETPRAGADFHYQLKVSNTGNELVTAIEVVDTVTIDGRFPRSTRSTLPRLDPGGDPQEVPRTFTVPESGGTELLVSATVLGVGPVLPPVAAMGSKVFNIEGNEVKVP